MRHNGVEFDSSHPIDSLIQIIDEGMVRASSIREDQFEKQNVRSLGVIISVLNLIRNNHDFTYGTVSLLAIKWGVPSRIIGDKGYVSSEMILEKKTKSNADQADSLLLLSYADFGPFAGIYCFFIYYIFTIVYAKYAKKWIVLFKAHLVPIFILFSVNSYYWNVEGKLDTLISWFFGSLLLLFVIFLMEKLKIVKLS